MYQIHCSYTGFFPLGYPFEFLNLDDAVEVVTELEKLTQKIPNWKKQNLQWKIWSTQTDRFVAERKI